MTTDARADDWLTLTEAAERLGLSVHQVRRQARAGRLVSRRVETDRGPAWRIRIDDGCQGDATVTAEDGQGDGASRQGDATVTAPAEVAFGELVDLVRDLQAQLTQAVTAAAMWQERARVLGDQLALAAPQLPVEASTVPESTAPTTEPSAPCWRRWRSWLAAGLVVAMVGSACCQGASPAGVSPSPAAASPTPAGVSLKQANLCRVSKLVLDQANVRQGNNPSWTTGYEPQVLLSLIEIVEKVC